MNWTKDREARKLVWKELFSRRIRKKKQKIRKKQRIPPPNNNNINNVYLFFTLLVFVFVFVQKKKQCILHLFLRCLLVYRGDLLMGRLLLSLSLS